MTLPTPTPSGSNPEEAVLIGIQIKGSSRREYEDCLAEMAFLADTAGVRVAQTIHVPRHRPDPAMVMGKGKAEEIRAYLKAHNLHLLIFDDLLTPMQERNLSRFFDCKILDRVQLILHIFAGRAKSREAQIQVELAQLKYLLPRLTRMWVHLSRQYGGVGTRGPGETQLEIDRRRIREKIHRLTQKCAELKKTRRAQRKGRDKSDIPCLSLVGYTNTGKSTLFTVLTGSATLAANQLFCTLDPLSRSVKLPSGREVVFTDTVGFIRRLPHFLVEAFKTTLEEVFDADYLLHVVDASADQLNEKLKTVHAVLDELQVPAAKVISVLNKIDLAADPEVLSELRRVFPEAVLVSARTGAGLDDLWRRLDELLTGGRARCVYRFSMLQLGAAGVLFRKSKILNRRYESDGLILEAEVDEVLRDQMRPYETGAPY